MTQPALSMALPERFPLSRREFTLIAVFWAIFTVLSIASRFLDIPGVAIRQLPGTVGIPLLEGLCWALLTPPIFVLAERLDAERLDAEQRRARWLMAMVAGGVLVAMLLGWLRTELRDVLTPRAGMVPADCRAGPVGPTGGREALDLAGRPRPDAVPLETDQPCGPRGGGGPPIWLGVLNALVLYAGTMAAGVARAYSRRYHTRREEAARHEARLQAQLAEARLESLQRQLDPHFLFNTLNAVSALVERDPRGVRRMIARLSELLRHSFERGGEAEVPLQDELTLLGRYVDIMQVRFQGRLEFETRVDDDVLAALVPSMILQPLVENAIKYGVDRLTRPGRVVVEVDVEGSELVLRVHDDGPGLETAAAPARRPGVGLRNTVDRLQQLYGDAQRFSLQAGPLGGTMAEIRLPYHERREAPEAHPARPTSTTDFSQGAAHVG